MTRCKSMTPGYGNAGRMRGAMVDSEARNRRERMKDVVKMTKE